MQYLIKNLNLLLSGSSNFTVVFPNKRYVKENIAEVLEMLTNITNDEDSFILKMYKSLASKVRGLYLTNLETLFKKYNFSSYFTGEDIELEFGVRKSRTLEIIKQLVENDMIEYGTNVKYKFKK